ncbi:MAG: hypothetical protein B7X10_06360 [Burkholderiales bacterium 21-58-4]|nr:MAG: hypothetical protein B7X10_06360 [Burkholderiales bacterium 21-58-4]
MKNILLLTSTIRPKANQPQLRLVSPEERLKDYDEALRFYGRLLEKKVLDKIVYVDNSGYDLLFLKERHPSRDIEWISFYDLDYDPSFHRGYGEFRLIDHAFSHAETLSKVGDGDRIWKITGRYKVKNLQRVIAMAPRCFDLYCNVHKGWAEMGFMAWSGTGYHCHIRDIWKLFATGRVPELILAEKLNTLAHEHGKIVTTFFWPPFIVGRRGTDGGSFQGMLTPFRFGLEAGLKLLLFPIRRMTVDALL